MKMYVLIYIYSPSQFKETEKNTNKNKIICLEYFYLTAGYNIKYSYSLFFFR
jgi:hypothetical protein